MNLNQYIMNELKKKEWTFEEISNVQTTINILAHKAYDHMTPKDKLDMVWNEIGEEFQKKVLMKIKAEIAETIKIELSSATVKFGGNSMEYCLPGYESLQNLYKKHKYLDAFTLTKEAWDDLQIANTLNTRELLLSGRLAHRLGSDKYARALFRLAHKKDSNNPEVKYFKIFSNQPKIHFTRP